MKEIKRQGDRYMKIVILERNSVGLDTSVDEISAFGDVTSYPNTTAADVKEKIKARLRTSLSVPM